MPSEKRDHEQILIVEGSDDKFAVLGLIENHFDWPDRAPWPVWIESAGGVEQILRKGYLSAEIKREKARAMGVLIDADVAAHGRYQRIVQLYGALFPVSLLTSIRRALSSPIATLTSDSESGSCPTIAPQAASKRFCNPSFHRTPLRFGTMRPPVSKPLTLGCACTGGDHTKAHLYTWLAWQNPPGQSPGNALKQRALDARSAVAALCPVVLEAVRYSRVPHDPALIPQSPPFQNGVQ